MPSPAMLRPREVAERLACDLDHVYALVAAGTLAASNIAATGAKKAAWRIDPADLDAFVASRRYRKPIPRQRRRRRKAATGYQRY